MQVQYHYNGRWKLWDLNKDKLRAWVQGGGILVLTEEAVTWAAQNGVSTVTFKRISTGG